MEPSRVIFEPALDLELVSRSRVFDELLRRLRSAHEEVCAHNAQLQLQADWVRLGKAIDTSVPKEGALPLSPNFKTRQVAAPRRSLPQDLVPQHCHPLQDPVSRRDAVLDLRSSIDQLALEQKYLNEKITKLVVTKKPSVSKPSTARGAVAQVSAERGHTSDIKRTEVDLICATSTNESSKSALTSSSAQTFRELFSALAAKTMHSVQPSLKRAVDSTVFLIITTLFMMSYMIFIAIETNMIAADPDLESLAITVCHYFFYSYFLVELGLRVAADGLSAFFGRHSMWNRLDALFACSAVIETIVEIFAQGSIANAGSVLLPVRVARVFRTVKILRNCNHLHEFQKMAYALGSSLKTLACSLSLLIFVMFLFAVGITQSAADLEKRNQIQKLVYFYGDLQSTMYTLYISVSGGLSWSEAYEPLWDLGWMSAWAFIVYVSITMFGVLNVVASIFIESVIRSLQHYRDLIVHDKELDRAMNVEHMKEVFRQLDADSSGDVTSQELEYFLSSEPSLRKYLEALDIGADDTRLLFKLLDRDLSGRINVEEFCGGCLRLKGYAKSIDMQTLMFQMGSLLEKSAAFSDYVVKSLDHLHDRLLLS